MLEDNPLTAVRDCLFNILAAALHSRWPSSSSVTWRSAMQWWQWRPVTGWLLPAEHFIAHVSCTNTICKAKYSIRTCKFSVAETWNVTILERHSSLLKTRLLVYYAVWSGEQLLKFHSDVAFIYRLILKIKVLRSFETSVNIYQSTKRNVPKYLNLQQNYVL
jgi:hypothetical protein